MLKQSKPWQKKFSLGISLKLFIAFWLVILVSVLLSYLVTMQFRHNPTQEQANPQQLKLLSQFQQKIAAQEKVRLKAIPHKFHQRHQQHLLIKNLKTNKVYAPRKRIWSKVRGYLQNNSLENPVTIDFSFTQVTASEPIMINGQRFQLFIATELQRKQLVNLVNQLPFAIRLVFLLAISFLCCWLLAKSFTRPLIAIQKASEYIGEGKLTTRINKYDQRSDEFGTLARSFNQMAEQLENNITTHQRLLGDVSHELRSPLTRLQLAVALAEKNMGNKDEQQKHLTRCETEVDRLDKMIADVLTLSRLEHSNNAFIADNTELNHFVEQVVNDCQYFANSKNVTITFKSEAHFAVLADIKLLGSAISNVVNNAIKYSSSDGEVNVVLAQENHQLSAKQTAKQSHKQSSQQQSQIILTVTDQGPGVPEDMITELFNPFFRVADGRERSSGGTGLGLAIAQQAIHLHQGEIYATNHQPNGLQVTIKLPITAA